MIEAINRMRLDVVGEVEDVSMKVEIKTRVRLVPANNITNNCNK